jgi:aspartyl-tRNA(Asn)/glutamyl-tRNA(Gln) amidotransferase subunit B
MRNPKFIPIIGIEVHVELKTDSKMFCGCSARHFQVKPNTHTCPVCLGLPGALPVPNQKAIEWCLLIGKTLDCQIAKESKFDRKNYFYPDLPKGYQISQYDKPFARNGELKFKVQSSKFKVIRINRVHMEEDTAKLIHRSKTPKFQNSKTPKDKQTLIDFNRSGVPLVEVVTEPDIHSSDEAVEYLKKLQQIIRYLEVSDADMEKGSMRCEINLSLIPQQFPISNFQFPNKIPNSKLPKYKVEIKNINSFKFVKKAIDYEIERQTRLLEKGETPLQETRGFDENSRKTYPQRTKEEAHDYRYFPEPDIPSFKISNFQFPISKVPELPDEKLERFTKEYGLNQYNARLLTSDKARAEYFEETVKELKHTLTDRRPSFNQGKFLADVNKIAKMMVNKKIDINKFTPQQLVKYLQKQKTVKVVDKSQLAQIISQVLSRHQKAVEDYKRGKKEVIGFLIGQVMKETGGKAEAGVVRELLVEKLNPSI